MPHRSPSFDGSDGSRGSYGSHGESVHRERFTLPASEVERREHYRVERARERERRARRNRWIGVGGVLVLLTTLGVIIEIAVNGGDDGGGQEDQVAASAETTKADAAGDATDTSTDEEREGPVPGEAPPSEVGALPDGGSYSEDGDGSFRAVGSSGAVGGDEKKAGDGTYSYVVETEEGMDESDFGGGDAFASMVDATLSDPRSWISTGEFAFRHIDSNDDETPDLRIRLASPKTTKDLCGGTIDLETSCFIQGADDDGGGESEAGRVVVNAARWVRGASTFEGDLGGYRQYVINHEVGHGIGYAAHQPCPEDGVLAPLMMQQTLSLNNGDLGDLEAGAEYEGDGAENTCRPNAWPYPHGRSEGEASDVRE